MSALSEQFKLTDKYFEDSLLSIENILAQSTSQDSLAKAYSLLLQVRVKCINEDLFIRSLQDPRLKPRLIELGVLFQRLDSLREDFSLMQRINYRLSV